MNKEKIDILTIEVGSTITKVNGFQYHPDDRLKHAVQGFAATSVAQGDVKIGVDAALADINGKFSCNYEGAEVFVNSSAAGGLRMTVHGLTYNMTARAAREASLGAGAIIKMVTAGVLTNYDLNEIKAIRPNMILLAGGVDFGARDAVLENAMALKELKLSVPMLYAGNSAIRKNIQELFFSSGAELIIAPNVFPDVDVLNVEPLRKIIQDAFSKHIVHAPGMEKLSELTSNRILPTPGAVLKAAEIFSENFGDILVIDVGGATTDVHSVTEGSREFSDKLVDPEPKAKRTVEGDLGVFINARNVFELDEDPQLREKIKDVRALPMTDAEKSLTRRLCSRAVEVGVRRHAGTISEIFTPTGRKQIIRGKDLTAVKWVIGTGGALTKIEGGEEILKNICTGPGKYLFPKSDAAIILDKNYLFSALGTIAVRYSSLVGKTFRHWVENVGKFE